MLHIRSAAMDQELDARQELVAGRGAQIKV